MEELTNAAASIILNREGPYVQRSNVGNGTQRSISWFSRIDHFSLPPCTRGRHPTAPFRCSPDRREG